MKMMCDEVMAFTLLLLFLTNCCRSDLCAGAEQGCCSGSSRSLGMAVGSPSMRREEKHCCFKALLPIEDGVLVLCSSPEHWLCPLLCPRCCQVLREVPVTLMSWDSPAEMVLHCWHPVYSTISILIVFPIVTLPKDMQGSGILLPSPELGYPRTAPS